MLPIKLRSGQKFIPAVSAKVNEIIDYLKTQRLVSDNRTIKINQLTSGVALSVINNPTGNLSITGSSRFNHPFKLSIVNYYPQGEYDEEEQTDYLVLNIQTGYLQMNGDDECRIAISYQDENELTPYVELPDEQGQYIVTLLCWYDPENEDSQMGWVTRVVYLTQDIQVTDMVDSCGFFYIMLGNILVQQNDDNELTYQITQQLVFSDFAVFDGNIKYPFKARFMMEEYPEDGQIIDQPIIPDYLVINPGTIYINGHYTPIAMQYHQLGENPFEKYYLLQINTFTNTATIAIARLQDYVYTEDQIIYNIPLCRLIIDSNSIYGIIQYIDNNFCFTLNDRKVLLNAEDQIPKYLEEKYIIPTVDNDELTEQQQSFYSSFPDNSYLKAVRYSETSSFSLNSLSSGSSAEEIELTGYYDQLYWDYQGIPSYNSVSSSSSNFQTLINDNNSLKWGDYGKVRVNEQDTTPDYLDKKIQAGQEIWKKVSDENDKLKIWTRKIKTGYNTNIKQENEDGDQEKPTSIIRTHKSVINTAHGIKKTETKTDENFTITYLIEVDYPNFALSIDSSIAQLLALEKNTSGIKIKSALQGSGILTVKSGKINSLPAPDTKGVLAWNGSNFTWARMGKGIDLKYNGGVYKLVNTCCSKSESSYSESISVSQSESQSQSMSVSQSESVSISVSVSNSESISQSISVSESISLSMSVSESVSISESLSNSNSESKSNSNSNSNSNSESKSNSNSNSNSKSNSKSDSNSESNSNSNSNSNSKSNSNSNSSSGEAIDCLNLHVSQLSITGTLEYYQYSCQQGETYFVMGEKYVFMGDTYDFYLAYDDGTYELLEQDMPISNSEWDRSYSCNMYEQPNRVRANIYRRGGYGPYGEVVEIYTYGTHILPWYNMDYECNQEQEFSSATRVISYPVATITLSKNTEN